MSTTKQGISIKLATTVDQFLHDLDFETFIWLNNLVSFLFAREIVHTIEMGVSNAECCRLQP